MTDPGTDQGVWVYAVGARLDSDLLAGMTGVAGEAVRMVDSAGLVAVVGSVALAELSDEALHHDLTDLNRLEAIARAHHRVVESVAQLIPVVPARLATIFHDDDRVRRMLAERAEDVKATLARVSGRHEWGVKGYAVEAPSAQQQPTPATVGSAAGSGTDYLRHRKANLQAREEARRSALAAAELTHRRLSAIAVAAQRQAAQDPQLSGEHASMVLNGAYLVDKAASEEFGDLVREIANSQHTLRLQLTGPWPPYSFATMDDTGGESDLAQSNDAVHNGMSRDQDSDDR